MKRTQIVSTAAALLFIATAAHAQRGQDDRRGRQDQHAQAVPQDQQRHGGDSRDAGSQRRADDRARADQERADRERANEAHENQARAAEEQNRRRAVQQGEELREPQNRQARQQEQLERAQRAERAARLEEEERRAQANRAYDRDRDDRSGYIYRYNLGGRYHETNQYGVDVLRQALNQGYQQGYRAGLIDRRDGAPADFRRAFDFENGEYGYSGAYVPESDYSYYFREGFQRGYDDGYWSRSRYGTFYNGNASILGNLVAGILGLTVIR